MNPRVPIPVVAALIEDADGYLLLGRRPPTKALPMKWEFPATNLAPHSTLIVFAGEFDLEAVGAVCEFGPVKPGRARELMAALVDKSMVVADVGRRTRHHP